MADTVETDVLVVGGGGAGCRAAIEAHDRGASVLLLVKGELGNSGCTLNVGTSAAVGPWADPGDSDALSMRDLLEYGGFLGNQELAKVLVEESVDRVLEMQRWGVDFVRGDDGEIEITQSAAHTFPRNFAFKPRNPGRHDYGSPPGIAMMDALLAELRGRGIRVLDEAVLIDLLAEDGRVVGATALDCRRNELTAIIAKTVVLATGSYSQIFSHTTVSPDETGDGQVAAYNVGAELIDMENTQFVPTSVGFPPGSVFRNALGEEFLPKYGIDRSRPATKEVMCHAVWTEVMEGRGTEDEGILIDMTGVWREGPAAAAFMERYEATLREKGSAYPGFEGKSVDPMSRPFETSPLAHTTTGGVRINARCESTVPGLYAAGAVAGGIYGHARPEGYTSMITLVFGRRAGLFAAEACKELGLPAVPQAAVRESFDRATDLVEKGAGIKPAEVKARVQATMRKHSWVIKEEEKLRAGLEEIREIGDIQRASAAQSTFRARPRDGNVWADALQVPSLLLCSKMMLEGSLVRKESRGAFFRREFPDTDNEGWLKNITYKQVDGELVLDAVPVELKYCGPADPTRAK